MSMMTAWQLWACALLIGQCMSLEYLRFIDVDDHLRIQARLRELGLPPQQCPRRHLRLDQYGWAETRMEMLRDTSLRVDPIVLRGSWNDCTAPQVRPYPLFPLDKAYRNLMLDRPPPDIVKANIERATAGEMSTVDEVVAKAMAWLERAGSLPLHDNELVLLASNFHKSSLGIILHYTMSVTDFGEWDEDFLRSQDDQRVTQYAALQLLMDREFHARGQALLRSHLSFQARKKESEEYTTDINHEIWASMTRFMDKQGLLGRVIFASEDEWVRRYNHDLAVLRAELYRNFRGISTAIPEPMIIEVMEPVVDAAERGSARHICSGVVERDHGFGIFLGDEEEGIRDEFGPLRDTVIFRLAYGRWRALSLAQRATYIAAALRSPGEDWRRCWTESSICLDANEPMFELKIEAHY